jgi:hypothetical protein
MDDKGRIQDQVLVHCLTTMMFGSSALESARASSWFGIESACSTIMGNRIHHLVLVFFMDLFLLEFATLFNIHIGILIFG